MDRRTRNVFLLALVALVVATAGAAVLLNVDRSGGSGSSQTVDGVIVAIDSEGLDRIRGFSIRTSDGQTIEFVMGILERGAEFPPGHLAEHQATAQPVRVKFTTDDTVRLAVRIEDAP